MMRFAFAMLVAIIELHASVANAETRVCSVKLGEVSSAVTRNNVDLHRMLRDAAENGLEDVKLEDVAAARRSLLSIALVRMETRRVEHGVAVDCLVSATLRRERDGAIYAMLDGRAQVEGQAQPGALEERALRAAVHGAIEGTPLALR